MRAPSLDPFSLPRSPSAPPPSDPFSRPRHHARSTHWRTSSGRPRPLWLASGCAARVAARGRLRRRREPLHGSGRAPPQPQSANGLGPTLPLAADACWSAPPGSEPRGRSGRGDGVPHQRVGAAAASRPGGHGLGCCCGGGGRRLRGRRRFALQFLLLQIASSLTH